MTGTVSQVDLAAGQRYDFTCASVAANGNTDIVWNLVENDASAAILNELDRDDVDNSRTGNCLTATNTDALNGGLTADFATHHNRRLQCVTSNDYGSAHAYIVLQVYSKFFISLVCYCCRYF